MKYINEAKRWQKLANIITEAVEVPSWLAGKLEKVHTKVGQGSVFTKSIPDVLKIVQNALDKNQDIDKIANSTGILTIQSSGIGYNLVLPIEQAEKLPGAKKIEATKLEGPLGNETEIKVPGISTTAPLNQFKTNDLTVIVRPKKDKDNNPIPGEYIVLSAYPGPKEPEIPRASEWNGKYAVIIPGGKEEMNENIDTSNWGKETDEYGDSEENFRFKPDLADFDYDEEAYKKYMAIHFPNEKIDLQELQYFHNGAKMNEVLDDLKDAQSAATWLKTQLDTYIENNLDDYGSGYKVEEQLEKLLKLVTKKFNIPENSFKIEDKYNTSYNEYDESTIEGEIKLNGQPILTYSSHGDGYGFNADINENALKVELEKVIKPISESFDQLDEIVDRVLAKMRKKLNENISSQEFEETIDELTYELVQDEYMGDTPTDLQSVADIISARAEDKLGQKVEFQLVQGDKIKYDIPGTDPYIQYTYSF